MALLYGKKGAHTRDDNEPLAESIHLSINSDSTLNKPCNSTKVGAMSINYLWKIVEKVVFSIVFSLVFVLQQVLR